MEIVIIILLAALVIFFLWDRLQANRRWKEQGDVLTRLVGEKVEGSVGVFGEVRERLGELTKRTRDIEEVGRSISSLQEALRAPKFRGGFGELGLERLLIDSLPAGSYFTQYRFKDGDIVDAAVRIGGNLVPIDSKFPFPLGDFERMVTSESPEEQTRLRRQFTRTLKKHVDDVSKYIKPDEKTFNFALMYIPAENIYYEAVVRCPQSDVESDVNAYCIQKKVFPVSPNTFYTYLQAIVFGLRGLQLEKSAGEIRGRLERLQGDLRDFQQDYELIGRHISNAARKHVEAETKLSRIGGRLGFIAGEGAAEQLPEADAEARGEGGIADEQDQGIRQP